MSWRTHRMVAARVAALGDRSVARPERRAPASPAAALGRSVRTMFGRAPSPARDRRMGFALLVGVVGALVSVPLGPLGGGCAWLLGWWRERQSSRRAGHAVVDEIPDLVDLLTLAVGSGLNVALAISLVAKRAPPRCAGALEVVLDQTARGARLADALDALPSMLGDPVRPVVAALTASERYGAPLLPALERVSLEVRLDRRRRAEEAIRRIPVTLLFPLVTCVLPAFALLTVAPLIAGALGALRH